MLLLRDRKKEEKNRTRKKKQPHHLTFVARVGGWCLVPASLLSLLVVVLHASRRCPPGIGHRRHGPETGPLPPCEQRLTAVMQGLRASCGIGGVMIKMKLKMNKKHGVSKRKKE